jgi:hypothetical protein
MPFDKDDCINEVVGTFMFCLVCMCDGDFTTALGLAACIMAFGASMNPAANFQDFAKGKFKDVDEFAFSFAYQLAGAGLANMAAPHLGFTAGSAPSNDFEQTAFLREMLGTMFFLAAAGACSKNAVHVGFVLMASVAVFGGVYNPAVTFSRIGFNGISDNMSGFLIMTVANFAGAFLANVSDENVKA